MSDKLFTPKEANKRLPYIKKIVLEILLRGRQLRMIIEECDSLQMPEHGVVLQAEIEGLIDELEELGCYYKDFNFEVGLVDFPAKIEEKDVFLCWRTDEPEVLWYHSKEEGYSGRTPIPKELL